MSNVYIINWGIAVIMMGVVWVYECISYHTFVYSFLGLIER